MVQKSKAKNGVRVLDKRDDRSLSEDKRNQNSTNETVEKNTKPSQAVWTIDFGHKHPMFFGHHQPREHWKVDVGLDISTSVIGVCFLNRESSELICKFHIDISSEKFETMWQKVDYAMEKLAGKIRWYQSHSNAGPPPCVFQRFFVEANAKAYKSGFTSADTLMTLAKMNGIISYECYRMFQLPIIDINVTSARKMIGYKDKKAVKKPVKEKVREFVLQTYPELKVETREVTKGKDKGKRVPVSGAADEIDAFVICRGGQLLNP